jgi:DNA-binding XRE family transcriptional regulator
MQLRAAREKSGKTQAQVAKEAKISEAQYQNIEYDKNEPKVRTAIRIARVLDSTVEELFGAATPDKTKEPDGNQAEN